MNATPHSIEKCESQSTPFEKRRVPLAACLPVPGAMPPPRRRSARGGAVACGGHAIANCKPAQLDPPSRPRNAGRQQKLRRMAPKKCSPERHETNRNKTCALFRFFSRQ